MIKKSFNIVYAFALALYNITIFTDFLPYNTFIKIFALILLIVDYSTKEKRKLFISPIFKPILALNAVILLNSLVGGDLSYIVTFTTNTLFLLFATQYSQFAKIETRIALILLVMHLVFAFFVELVPQSIVDDVFSKIILNNYNSNYSWRNVTGINVGLTNQPGVLATYMVALSAICYAKYFKRRRLTYIVGYILSMAIILLTTKRSAILFSIASLVIVSVIFTGRKIKKHLSRHFGKYIVFIITGVVMSLELNKRFDLLSGILDKNEALLESNDLSNGRFSIWEDSMTYFSDKPIFGIGLKNYYELNGYDIHNTYIQFLVETGIIGFISLVMCVLKVLFKSIIGLKKKFESNADSINAHSIAGLYLLVFLVLYGFVGNTFIDYAPMSLFMISVGLIDSDLYPKEKKA
jgi:O-antigen ligase